MTGFPHGLKFSRKTRGTESATSSKRQIACTSVLVHWISVTVIYFIFFPQNLDDHNKQMQYLQTPADGIIMR